MTDIDDWQLRLFYEDWKERFKDESCQYITPKSRLVTSEVMRADIDPSASDVEKAYKLWEHVVDVVEYKISEKWKTPEETLTSGLGDCEDFTFLLASMFPVVGVESSEVVAGDLIKPGGETEAHAWNEVDGHVIDATGTKESVSEYAYKKQVSVTVISDGKGTQSKHKQ